jgi:CheY-like chemotaxis protein
MNVLVIDDDTDDVELFCEALHEIDPGIKCFDFKKVPTAVEHLKENNALPAYIFLDAHIPSSDTPEILKEIRSIPRLNGVKIIIYSGYVTDREIAQYKQLGAFDVVIKPNSYTDLCEKLASLIGR